MFEQYAFSLRARTLATLALAILFSATTFAADSVQSNTGSKINLAAAQKALAARLAGREASFRIAQTKSAAIAPGNATPAEIFANPYVAYPPSCLNDGLPGFGQPGLPYVADPNAQQFQVNLPSYDSSTGAVDQTETDTVTVWRVPCSGGVSATLLEIDRPSSPSLYALFPNIYLTQSGSTNASYPRLPQDPNTVFSDTVVQSSFSYGSVYVFEYYNPDASLSQLQTDYNQAFTLNVDTLTTDGSGNEIVVAVDMPAYSPANFNNFPSASAPMEISGYMSTNWTNPNQSGEGIVLQVYDDGDKATRTLSFAWFTYDDSGLPFWLFGSGTFNIGATSVTATTVYLDGGKFAPSTLQPAVQHPSWGTVTFSFPDCGHMNIAYNGDASAVNGPKGNSTATYLRVADVNSLVCQ